MRRLVFLAVVALLTANCQRQRTMEACTLIGCEDGLTVQVVGALPATYTVTARANGQVVGSVQCGAANPCTGGVFMRGVTATQLDIEITGAGVNVQRQVTPTYTVTRPNGPRCPPECRQGRVQIQM